MTEQTFIIAEAGVNHNGDLALAERLVDAAAESGADAVKFQTFRTDALVTATAAQATYQAENTGVVESQAAMLRRLELSAEAHRVLMARAAARGIAFLSTPFDLGSIDFLASLGLRTFKVGSGELTNLPYLRHLAEKRPERIILSTGMGSLDEVDVALRAFEHAGCPRSHVTVLHCHTAYPTAFSDVNLRAMCMMRDALGVRVGYSDHTFGITVAIAAVALGAMVIEKHMTLDRSLPGPDHKASLEPEEIAAMVRAIRNIEVALGDGVKRPTATEVEISRAARKSIVAVRAIRRGEVITPDTLTTKRPGTGLSPMRWDAVIGTRAIRDFAEDECIEVEEAMVGI